MALAAAGAPHGLWLRAETQTNGKGRQGRNWSSSAGNLHASTLVRLMPADPPAPTLALVAAVALDQLINAHVGAGRSLIKWPNDILLTPAQAGGGDGDAGPVPAKGHTGSKVAGILLERAGDAVVVGFGVNLAHHPDDIDRPAISLAGAGVHPPEPGDFLIDLAESFAAWLGRWRGEGLTPVRQRWLERAHPIGTALSVRASGNGTIDGLFDGLDETGALRLRLADGSVHVMHAGDVFLI